MTNPNDPAFPAEPKTQNDLGITYHGMSKREYFAAMAMQAFLQGSHWMELMESHGGQYDWKHISEASLGLADAFIAELNKDAGKA